MTIQEFKVGEVTEIRNVPEGYTVEETVDLLEMTGSTVRNLRTGTPQKISSDTKVRIIALPGQPKPSDMILLKVMTLGAGLGSTLRSYESCIYWMKESYEHPDRHADRLTQVARHASEASAYHAKARGQYEGLLCLIELLGATPIPDYVQESIDLAKSHNVKI